MFLIPNVYLKILARTEVVAVSSPDSALLPDSSVVAGVRKRIPPSLSAQKSSVIFCTETITKCGYTRTSTPSHAIDVRLERSDVRSHFGLVAAPYHMNVPTVFLSLLAAAAATSQLITVQTSNGPIQGFVGGLGGGVFKGVPFASPPVGPLRTRCRRRCSHCCAQLLS